jgi:hypothetical protein
MSIYVNGGSPSQWLVEVHLSVWWKSIYVSGACPSLYMVDVHLCVWWTSISVSDGSPSLCVVDVRLCVWWMSISASGGCPSMCLVDVHLRIWWMSISASGGCPTLRLVDVHVCPCMPVSVYKWDVSRWLESLHFNTIYSLYGSIQETFARNWILSCRKNSAKKRRKELGYRTIKMCILHGLK